MFESFYPISLLSVRISNDKSENQKDRIITFEVTVKRKQTTADPSIDATNISTTHISLRKLLINISINEIYSL